jgi:thymidylate synthase (FAD)
MKLIEPSYEILTEISSDGIKELKYIERIARICYKSEDKITEDGESAKKLVGMLIKKGHEAMLEHSMLSVLFTCDRGISHELVRHRIASFAQVSQRYVNYSLDKNGGECAFILPEFWDVNQVYAPDGEEAEDRDAKLEVWKQNMERAEDCYLSLIDSGARPEQARTVLPNSTATEIVVTANYREWRNILKLRTESHAHPSMRYLMIPLLKELKDRIPVIFDDIMIEGE